MRDFRKYEIWVLSHEFMLEIYKIITAFPESEKYGITSQIRRASISIPTNIAEGCGRSTDADFNRFIVIALGSAHEVEYLLIASLDLGFINPNVYEDLNRKINLIKQKLYKLSLKLK